MLFLIFFSKNISASIHITPKILIRSKIWILQESKIRIRLAATNIENPLKY